MKIFIFLSVIFILPSIVDACSPARALEYAYRASAGDGPIADTVAGKIKNWLHATAPKPDDAAIAIHQENCRIAINVKSSKKADIKAEAIRRARLIDSDFTEESISVYRRLNVAALDTNGLAIRDILIYGYQQAQWVNTASEININAYNPKTDNGWPTI